MKLILYKTYKPHLLHSKQVRVVNKSNMLIYIIHMSLQKY